MIIVECNTDLVQVVLAARAARGLAGSLHRWQQQCDEDSDNGDDYQKFDEREAMAVKTTFRHGNAPYVQIAARLIRKLDSLKT
jgi:hypothetical protein